MLTASMVLLKVINPYVTWVHAQIMSTKKLIFNTANCRTQRKCLIFLRFNFQMTVSQLKTQIFSIKQPSRILVTPR